jgi:hypothetical protein
MIAKEMAFEHLHLLAICGSRHLHPSSSSLHEVKMENASTTCYAKSDHNDQNPQGETEGQAVCEPFQ